MFLRFRPAFCWVSSEISQTCGFSKYILLRPFSNSTIRKVMDSKVEKEKEKYHKMPLEEKRHLYRDKSFVVVDQIQTWADYFQKNKDRLKKQFSEYISTKEVDKCTADPTLNKKVSIWDGNITHLEIDAIANAANKSLLGGGGVDGAIHAAAGPGLRAECATLNGCQTGEAKITAGYLLPAKHVIHTVGPVGENSLLLKSCYKNCFQVLKDHKLRVLAFPCISTGSFVGYPNEPAAHIALGTTRKFLEKNPDSVDRVIFCLFLKKDVTIYENLMQIYFPIA
ncbi:hypothetical protein L9F63_024476 [Diploptera punctata]|uniref:Macro domain-containing protein n=1 Tax=Diploptera punctata TaxID=6984 RepID=A0AAD8E7E2_DIPPU|nr:hypothetical protein L9F63_024476 [Diploptera punctata]